MKKQFRRRKKNVAFIPNREYIQAAVQEFLNHGGQITFLTYRKESEYSVFVNDSVQVETDQFLLGD